MSYDIEKFKILCAGYFLNNLDDHEIQELKEMLASKDENLLMIFNEVKNSYENISLIPEQHSPPANLKRKIIKNIKKEPTLNIIEEKSTWKKYRFSLALSFAVFVIMVAVLYTFTLNKEINQLRDYADELSNKIDTYEEKLSLLNTDNILSLEMEGLEGNPQSKGRLIWGQAETDIIMLNYSLPKEKDNKVYKVWIFSKNNSPLKAGILSVKDNVDENYFITEVKIKERYPITGFLITLEDKNSEAPDGERFLGALHKPKSEK